MNNTFKTITLATALALPLILSVPSFAQPAQGTRPGGQMGGQRGRGGMGSGGMRGGGMMRRMAQELGLSEAQKAQLGAMMKDNGAKRRAIQSNKSLSPDQKKAQMKALRTSSETRMKAVLTPAQRTKLAAMMSQRMREHGGKPGAPAAR